VLLDRSTEIALRILVTGAGATALTDLWGIALRWCGISTINFAFLGRWVGTFSRAQWFHKHIADSPSVPGELWLGWCLHYSIGIAFAGILCAIFGPGWFRHPSVAPALCFGIATVTMPLLVMQPAFGAGVASFKTPTPIFNSLKSLSTHVVFGVGLYLTALALTTIVPTSVA